MADPTKKRLLTEDEIRRISFYSGMGLSVTKMSALIGISKATFERRYKDQPELVEALLKGRAQAESAVTKSCYDQAVSGRSPTMTIFWLKCRAGWKEAEFSDKEDKAYTPPATLKAASDSKD